MAVSTVQLNGTTLMTVNDTTATASDVAIGEYFYAADGTKTEGTVNVSGGTLPHLLDHVEYTMVTDATSSSRQEIQLTAVGSSPYVVFLTPKVVPTPPSEGYTAYNWVRVDLKASSGTFGTIIRADGTTGTDQNMGNFTPSTGILLIGGQWGTFRTGQVFDIYLFELT